MSLLDKRLVVLTGKGGVGRSSGAAALAIAAAHHGKRACVVELSGMASVPPMFGLKGRSFEFRRATDGVHVWSLTVQECLEDFGRRKLHLPGLVRRLFHTQATRTFVDAIPGLHDLLQLGKLENLINEPRNGDPTFDLFVVDAPATGHGLTLLSAARSMTDIAKAGPFHDLAENIGQFLEDRSRTSVGVITLPEELPVSESLELVADLDEMGMAPEAVIVNRCDAPPIPPQPSEQAILKVLSQLEHGTALVELLQQTTNRYASQRAALSSLRTHLPDMTTLTLPRGTGLRPLPFELGLALAESL